MAPPSDDHQAPETGSAAAGEVGPLADPASPVQSPKRRRKKAEPPRSFGCTFAEYQEVPGVNWSTLKHLDKSPLHYKHHLEQPPEETSAMMAGRAVHTAVLEPDRFPLDYAVFTGARRQGNDWEAFKEANQGRSILKVDEYREALAIRDAVRAHKVADRILSGGIPERVITWDDPETGIACKGRLDYLKPDGFADLKTSASLDERRFQNTAHDLGYHMQLAWYARGLKALGMADPTVWIVAVEAGAPHDVAPFRVDPGVLATGDERLTELLALLVDCQKRKRWPGRYPEETTFLLPGWSYTQAEAEFEETMGLTVGGTDA